MEPKILEIIRERRSIRKFSPLPVEDEKISTLLEAARLAPSSCNSQPWRFIVIKDREKIKQVSTCVPIGETVLGEGASNSFISRAGLIIVGCANPRLIAHRGGKLLGLDCLMLDMGIALEHIVLAATELGLGTCWLGYFSARKLKKALGIPALARIAALLAVGYPAPESKPGEQKRKKLEEIYSVDRY